jgi:hypothetical protein
MSSGTTPSTPLPKPGSIKVGTVTSAITPSPAPSTPTQYHLPSSMMSPPPRPGMAVTPFSPVKSVNLNELLKGVKMNTTNTRPKSEVAAGLHTPTAKSLGALGNPGMLPGQLPKPPPLGRKGGRRRKTKHRKHHKSKRHTRKHRKTRRRVRFDRI